MDLAACVIVLGDAELCFSPFFIYICIRKAVVNYIILIVVHTCHNKVYITIYILKVFC